MNSEKWQTAITKIEPNKIQIRGYPVDELMGKISFSQAIYLVIRGELPSTQVGKLLDAILVSSIDHGVTPPSAMAALTATSTGAALNGALASGILSINAHHGGAVEGCMAFLQAVQEKEVEAGVGLQDSVDQVLTDYRQQKRRVPGFGHRLHTADPRSRALFELADTLELSGHFVEIARMTESRLREVLQKTLPMNVDGAIAAVLCDLQIPKELANAFFIMARVPGLVAHIYEEKTTQRPMRKINAAESEYVGPEGLKI